MYNNVLKVSYCEAQISQHKYHSTSRLFCECGCFVKVDICVSTATPCNATVRFIVALGLTSWSHSCTVCSKEILLSSVQSTYLGEVLGQQIQVAQHFDKLIHIHCARPLCLDSRVPRTVQEIITINYEGHFFDDGFLSCNQTDHSSNIATKPIILSASENDRSLFLSCEKIDHSFWLATRPIIFSVLWGNYTRCYIVWSIILLDSASYFALPANQFQKGCRNFTQICILRAGLGAKYQQICVYCAIWIRYLSTVPHESHVCLLCHRNHMYVYCATEIRPASD